MFVMKFYQETNVTSTVKLYNVYLNGELVETYLTESEALEIAMSFRRELGQMAYVEIMD